MTRICFSKDGYSPFQQLIGHNVHILQSWISLESTIINDSSLDALLLEQVRRTLAFGNQCEYCMVKGGHPSFGKEDARMSLACAFAELYALDHKAITDSHFEVLKEEFTDVEISELCSFISFISASQSLGRIYNLTEEYQENKAVGMSELQVKGEDKS